MKKVKLFFAVFVVLVVSAVVMAFERPVSITNLPAGAQTFVTTHFKGQQVFFAEKNFFECGCDLSNGTQIDFSNNGDWKKIDCNDFEIVPATVIPAPIKHFVQANFPGCFVNKIEKKFYGYSVDISNDIELKFNKQGALLRMDD